jgi:hypothetical protein
MGQDIHPKLNLPVSDFAVRKRDSKDEIFDTIRKQWLVLTPEEWVRQHMVRYLINHLGYPAGLTAIEKGFDLNGIPYRADIVTYDRSGSALLAVECKAPGIRINQKTFDQIGQYNKVIRAHHLAVTNGLTHYCVSIGKRGQWAQADTIPAFAKHEESEGK